MNDILSLIQILGATALIVAPAVLVKRLLGAGEGGTLADLFAVPLDPPWPRGVQEEEPAPWRMERLRQPAKPAGRQFEPATPRSNPRPAALGPESSPCG